MNFSALSKEKRDQYIKALTEHWQLSFQRWAFIQLTIKIDHIISSLRFEPITESLLQEANDRAREAVREWSQLHSDCPALSDTSRFWVKLRTYPNYGTDVLRMEVSDEMRYLSTGTCYVNMVERINQWPDYTLEAAYCREILKEEV